MKNKLKGIERFYNGVVGIYHPFLFLFFQKGRKKIAKKLNNNSTLKIADLGCNDALITTLLNNTHEYTGVDIAEKSIQKAQRRSLTLKMHNTNLVVGDIETTTMRNNHFDAVLLMFVLSVTPNPDALLNKSHDILKSKGKLYVLNHFSSAFVYRWLDTILSIFLFKGVNFYFPISTVLKRKDFNIVSRTKVNVFWTLLELEKI